MSTTAVSDVPQVLTRDVSVPLCAVLVRDVATEAGLRTLVIKGPAMIAQGLRRPRASADVDVLVEPGHADDLVVALARYGWYWRPVPTISPRVVAIHSTTIIHDRWPNDIDVHHIFPGFLLTEAELFETLWQDHTTVELAHQPIAVPSRADHVLIETLHVLRAEKPDEALADPRMRTLLDVVRADPALLDHVMARATALRCVSTAEPFLAAAGVAPRRIADASAAELADPWRSQEFQRWQAQRTMDRGLRAWFNAIGHAPLRRRPAMLRQALFPSAKTLFSHYPAAGRGPVRDYWFSWWQRFRKAVRLDRDTLRDLRRFRSVRMDPEAWTDTLPPLESLPEVVHSAQSAAATDAQSATGVSSASGPRGDDASGGSDTVASVSGADDLQRWQLPPRLGFVTSPDGLITVLTPRTYQVLALAGSGSALLEALADGATVAELVDEIEQGQAQASAIPSAVRADVSQFVSQLRELGVLEPAAAAGR